MYLCLLLEQSLEIKKLEEEGILNNIYSKLLYRLFRSTIS